MLPVGTIIWLEFKKLSGFECHSGSISLVAHDVILCQPTNHQRQIHQQRSWLGEDVARTRQCPCRVTSFIRLLITKGIKFTILLLQGNVTNTVTTCNWSNVIYITNILTLILRNSFVLLFILCYSALM